MKALFRVLIVCYLASELVELIYPHAAHSDIGLCRADVAALSPQGLEGYGRLIASLLHMAIVAVVALSTGYIGPVAKHEL